MTPARMAAIHAAAFSGQGRVWTEGEFRALCERSTIKCIAAGHDGFALVQVMAPEAEILTLAVDPHAQRVGLGTTLVESVIAFAQSDGADTVFLEVAEDNAAARALYAKSGFTETGRRRHYYSRPGGGRADALVLSRALAAEKTGIACKS